jgi:hypothetical protein
VNPGHIVFGAVLAAVLLVLGIFYFWRQLRTLRRLANSTLPDEEQIYSRYQARWRLLSSGLLILLAVLLTADLAFLEQPAHDIAEKAKAGRDAGEENPLTDTERLFVKVYGWFWIGFLLILLGVVLLAAVDLWSTRLYAWRARRRLQDDRRAMIERQVHRLRQERNERN